MILGGNSAPSLNPKYGENSTQNNYFNIRSFY